MTPTRATATIDFESLANDLAALANERRLRLLTHVDRPKYGEEIAEVLDLSRQSALRHVKQLQESGFVRQMHGRRESGPVVEYQVVPSRLFEVGIAIQGLASIETSGGPSRKFDERTVGAWSAEVTAEHAPRPGPVVHAGSLVASNGAGTDATHPSLIVPDEPVVRLVSGPSAGKTVSLDGARSRWTIGRAEDRDIRIPADNFVSQVHCEIQRNRYGFEVVDAMSSNRTLLNFEPLPRGQRAPLRVGDVITMGYTSAVFQWADA